jgi:hypothetical protein
MQVPLKKSPHLRCATGRIFCVSLVRPLRAPFFLRSSKAKRAKGQNWTGGQIKFIKKSKELWKSQEDW